MSRESIGALADEVWSVLTDNNRWTFGALKKRVSLTEGELGAALGWLACEGKIEFDATKEEIFICLCLNVYIG